MLVVFFYATRVLGAEAFGRLGFLYQTVLSFASIIAPSLGWTNIRWLAAKRLTEREQISKYFSMHLALSMLISIALALLVVMFAPYLAWLWFHSAAHAAEVRWLAVAIFSTGVITIQLSCFAGLQAFELGSLLNILRGLVGAGLIICGVHWYGSEGGVAGLSLGTLVSVFIGIGLIMHLFHRDGYELKWGWLGGHVREMLGFTLPALLNALAGSGTLWLGTNLVLHHPDGLHQMAILTAALHWRNLVLFLPTMMNQAALPQFTELYACNDFENLGKRLQIVNRIALFTMGLPCLFLMLMSKPIMVGLYNLNLPFQEIVFILTVVSAVPASLSSTMGYVMVAMGKMWDGLKINLLWGMLFLGVFATVPAIGSLRFAIALVVSWTLLWWIVYKYILYQLNHHKSQPSDELNRYKEVAL
jgi:O-antigen/teichoic acid export membrane protein